MNVFFYGLFMDAALLAKKGIKPRSAEVGYVDEFALRIGERATLVSSAGARSYGVMMNISSDQAEDLYSDKSVADYVPESVIVEFSGGRKAEAKCYNLPVGKVTGTNKIYAEALFAVASKRGLPESYLVMIREAAI